MSDKDAASGPASSGAFPHNAVKWLGIGLVLSLAINFFIVGVIATKLWQANTGKRLARLPKIIDAQVDSRKMMRSADKERRKELRKIVRGYRDTFEPHAERLDAARRRLAAVVRESRLDRSKLEAAFRDVQLARTEMRDVSTTMIVELISAMTADEREKLAEQLERRKRKKKSGTKKKKESTTDAGGVAIRAAGRDGA